jgi:hypothetical protein
MGEYTMAKNEKTSSPISKIAAKVLRTGHATPKEAQRLAGSALTQRPDKKK